MRDVAVLGGSGFTGGELVKLLVGHPKARLRFVTAERWAGRPLRALWRQAPSHRFIRAEDAPLAEAETLFLCLPHGESAPWAARAIQDGVRVVDLSADLRLSDPADYRRWYGLDHPAPQLLPAPYGIPELWRDALVQAPAIAGAGCYATAVLLALVPLVRAGLVRRGEPLWVDAKSGVSGAGRTPQPGTHFCAVHGNFSAYKPGRCHRHVGEIEQQLAVEGVPPGRLIFVPHLLPTDRGILANVYLQVEDAPAAQATLEGFYRDEPLVDVLPSGELPTLADVVRTPRAALSSVAATARDLIVGVALDNLLKGAASQALQAFNAMWQLPETTGLLRTPGPAA